MMTIKKIKKTLFTCTTLLRRVCTRESHNRVYNLKSGAMVVRTTVKRVQLIIVVHDLDDITFCACTYFFIRG
jgi:hypothetical protein